MKGTNINENRLFNSLGWLHRPGHGLVCQFAGWISGCRITCFMGGILCIAGLLATSFAKSPAVAHFTYGLMYGMGACFIYNSYFLVVGTYFKQKLSLAVVITALGSGAAVLYNGPLL